MHLPVSISAISLEVFCTQVYSFQKKNCVCFSSVVTFVAQLYLEQAFFLEKQHEQTFVVCGTTISGRTVLPRKAAYEQTFADHILSERKQWISIDPKFRSKAFQHHNKSCSAEY
ncbi:hypothetical protein O6H91_12G066800 [Diphasiastrum complanatum]|uniref:Uncharacterized protein n=1 Tax=Diphasiastrum complanatum TaxID=34168 RepID=A0ACC2C367_DIPCM|nr:hypothetical protein O6H91_12G066800 [Diphasiastrum complanatum]